MTAPVSETKVPVCRLGPHLDPHWVALDRDEGGRGHDDLGFSPLQGDLDPLADGVKSLDPIEITQFLTERPP